MKIEIPASLREEHEEIHAELKKIIQEGGRVRDAAEEVAQALHPHFVKEEEYAMPPLGLLSALAGGKVIPEITVVTQMTDKLKAELPEMIREHEAIAISLDNLRDVMRKENRMEHFGFVEKLLLHAKNEEEVLYPAAILVGEYLKEKLRAQARA